MDGKHYGFWGWKEFASNRNQILREYDTAKERNQSRPVKTEHGNAGEAAIRAWLENMLPAKYGVTSGYIIPDLIVEEQYKVYHYDVIIYDKLNSPILWIDSNYDQSIQGRKLAIPAKYVNAIIEIKASFNYKSIKDSIDKISEVKTLAPFLPHNFSSSIIFIEIGQDLPPTDILRNLLPSSETYKYDGGIILRCQNNPKISGLFRPQYKEESQQDNSPGLIVPIAADIDELDNVYYNSEGHLVLGEVERGSREQGVGVMGFYYDGKFHFSKQYGPHLWQGNLGIDLSWSYNSFVRYSLDLLSRLEGKELNTETPYIFGQVFDKFDRR